MIDADTGWVFRSGDVDDLARVLAEIAAAPDARVEEMGRRARLRAESEFNRQRYLDGVLDVYRGLGIRC